MRIVHLRPLLLGLVWVSSFTAIAQVNDKGTFHIGFAWNGGVHGTRFENSYASPLGRISNSDNDGAVTVSFPLDVRYGLSKSFTIGLYLEPGTYLDSNATRSNAYFLFGLSGRYYLMNKDHFGWDAGLDLGTGALRIDDTSNGHSITDTYAGGHIRLCTDLYFYFGRVFGVNVGLKYAAYDLTWRDRDPSDPVLDAADYEAKLKTSGIQFQVGLQVRL